MSRRPLGPKPMTSGERSAKARDAERARIAELEDALRLLLSSAGGLVPPAVLARIWALLER